MTNEQINELVDNLDFGLRCFVHKKKKTIMSVPDTIDKFDSDSALWKKAIDEIENNFNSYMKKWTLMSHFD